MTDKERIAMLEAKLEAASIRWAKDGSRIEELEDENRRLFEALEVELLNPGILEAK